MAFKFAFLGCWHSHTGMHVRESTANPSEFELVGIYDNNPTVVAERAKRWNAHVFPSVEAVFEKNCPDFWIYCYIF